MSKCAIFVVFAVVASAHAGLLAPAVIAPYASSFNAHHINHAVAHPLLAPAPVHFPVPAPNVFAAPASSVLTATAPLPALLPGPLSASALLPGPFSSSALFAGHAHALPAPAFIPSAPAPFGYPTGLPGRYLW